MNLVKIWNKTIKGKLYVVGDIHGCYDLLMNRLIEIGFNFENDLLVAVGDLVDRGIQNIECVSLIDQPWFTSIRGNHEDLCIKGLFNESFGRCHIANGGEWFYDLDAQTQHKIINKFNQLPIALEITHQGRKFGFVHGHIEQNDWELFKHNLNHFDAVRYAIEAKRLPTDAAMWGRERFDLENPKYTKVQSVDLVIMGHTITTTPIKRDNCYYIDTGAVYCGSLTILELSKI